ncbi:hypothetical protein H0H93_006687 [Arthromyces matolae]|nr:hypothetical protein H0H93_006687 [Arthromyces matolae]
MSLSLLYIHISSLYNIPWTIKQKVFVTISVKRKQTKTSVYLFQAVACRRCGVKYGPDEYGLKKNQVRLLTCKKCTEYHAQRRAKQRESREPRDDVPGKKPGPKAQDPDHELLELSWKDMMDLVKGREDTAFTLDAMLDLASFAKREPSNKGTADALAKEVYEQIGYRFIYKTTQPSRTSDTTKTYVFYCAQLDREMKKQKEKETDPKKQRARMYMDRFPCNGYFRVTMTDERPNEARVRLTHHRPHCPYVDINVDTATEDLVKSMKNMTPSKIWDEVIRGKKTELTEKQIYAAWMKENEAEWRLADDQVESAIQLLRKLGEKVEVIPLAREDGMNTIAFSLREVLERYGDEIEEIAMDSTWKTNALGYELYAILGEANGQGIPVAFAFTTSTDGTAPAGAKDRMMQQVIRHVYSQCQNIRFTLSDKDISEINALRAEIPTAKHQLCYWHAIRYITERLAKNEPPAAYDPRKANAIFDFIDPTWVLGVDTDKWLEEGVREVDAETSPSRDSVGPLKIVIPKLTNRSTVDNGTVTGSNGKEAEEQSTSELEGIQQIGNSSRKAPTQTCLPPLLVVKAGDIRIPIWPSPPKVPKAERPEFCPEEYRSPIVELFRKHLHQHSTIPLNEVKVTYLTPEEIHYRAVKEIYMFCRKYDLSQTWAYMWNRWYTPKQWRLWARAACMDIPRLKTTMVVEGFWKQLKRRDLVHFNRPRLDLVTHIILTSILPRVALRLDYIQGLRRQGRPQPLAEWQADFRDDWMEMSKPDELRKIERELKWLKADVKTPGRAERLAEIEEDNGRKAGTYHTSIAHWTCSCPAYLISRFLLCKHLVRMGNKILSNKPLQDLRFFLDLRRQHQSPYYMIPGVNHDRENSDEDEIEVEIEVLGYKQRMYQHTTGSPAPVQLKAKEMAPAEGPPAKINVTDTAHEEVEEEIDESDHEDDASEEVEPRRVSFIFRVC